jgi:hypothetical protein
MAVKGFVDYENLKNYDILLKNYIDQQIDQKVAEAIEAYRIEDTADDNIIDDQSDDDIEEF